MLVIQCDSTLMSDLADATKRAELLKNPWAFLKQYGLCPDSSHSSTLINRLPGLDEGQQSMLLTETNTSVRPTSLLVNHLDPHWQ
jgi:hypothetical protein